jgi:HEAT repeats
VRLGLAILLAAAFAAAEEDAELARTVDALVQALGSPSTETRTLARFRLASYGDRVRPLLERVESPDPEVRRVVRMLTRPVGRVEMEILPRTAGPLSINAPLVLDVRIINNTEQTLTLLPLPARQGSLSPFRVRVGKKLVPVAFDEVNWGTDGTPRILPGAARRFRLTLPGGSAALRRPALHDVSVVFEGNVARGYGLTEEDAVETQRLSLETASVQVHVAGRKAEDLEAALRSDDPRQRDAAVAELSARDDDAIVPILRRHALERPLRLAAVHRLGALGAEEDFKLVYEATRDESVDIRRAAVLGLGKYPTRRARSRLLALSTDEELRAEAILALRGHKHHATIECYLGLLPPGKAKKESVGVMQEAIREWTGHSVDQRPSEILAFRGWWEKNREQWAKKNNVTDR